MIEHLKEYILKNKNKFFEVKNPDKLTVIQISGTNIRKEFNKIIFLIFEKNSRYPLVCAIISRDNRYEEWLIREYKNLRFIHESTSDLVKKSIPRPIALEKIENYSVLFETAVPGRSLEWITSLKSHFRSKKNVSNIFRIAENWLVQFFKETNKFEKYKSYDEKKQYMRSIINTYRKNFALSEQEKNGLDDLSCESEEVAKSNISFLPQHMHFWVGSLFLLKDKINVIDWKVYGESYLPLFDFLSFTTTYGLKFNKSSVTDSFLHTYFKKDWFSGIVCRSIFDYCSELQLDTKYVRPLLALYVIESANYAYSMCRPSEPYYIQLWRGLLREYLFNKHSFIIK
jgi:hypothetical protein